MSKMSERHRSLPRCAGLALALGLLACSSATPIGDADQDEPDADQDDDISRHDAEHDEDISWPDADHDDEVDAAPSCECNTDEPLPGHPVYLFHDCTPPLESGCEALTCVPGEEDCPEGYSCDQWGAAACCYCAAAAPACVRTGPVMDPLPEYLSLWPTTGAAGEEQDLVVSGFPFYIGALFYLGRVGDSGDLPTGGGDNVCSLTIHAPARGPGMVPVWVSQYGGGEPWVLSGFFLYSAGDLWTCAQPGYPCSEDLECCETPEVPMSCQAGRCRRL